MAQYNKSLGRFQLSGIPSAPRGVPQIEVTFDIDANGIVHVSAKDLGTGNEQKITIAASTNLSDADIDKAVKEAEKFAGEDKKRKEEIDARNSADSLIYQSEKSLKDLGDKVSAEDKTKIEDGINQVKESLKGTDTEAIKKVTEELQQAFYDVSSKIYQQAGGAPGADPNAAGFGGQQGETGNGTDDNVVDADYKVVDDDK